MENTNKAELALRFRVGLFTIMGIALLGAITIFVNNKPFWWRPCEKVQISVKDATGLKPKSEVRSLGLQIGYLESVELFEMHVKLAICVTAPVDILPATRAFIRGEGILGDKFVELKPVRYRRADEEPQAKSQGKGVESNALLMQPSGSGYQGSGTLWTKMGGLVFRMILDASTASAEDDDEKKRKEAEKKKKEKATDITYSADGTREIPVGKASQDIQEVVDEVENLVSEMGEFTTKLKESINPEELRDTITKLNLTLENASQTLSPEGNLTTTAQRTLAKLEDAIEQMRDMLTRVNQGKGSIGRIVNDDVFADELERAVKNINNLLDRANNWKIMVDLGFERLGGYNESRGAFQIELWPRRNKFYRLGLAVDPRGVVGQRTQTVTNGSTSNTSTVTFNDRYGFQFIFQLGIWLGDASSSQPESFTTMVSRGLRATFGREKRPGEQRSLPMCTLAFSPLKGEPPAFRSTSERTWFCSRCRSSTSRVGLIRSTP
jgi:phospholipid/cholesterol/gamma-HCH transport system substrate-binding protein